MNLWTIIDTIITAPAWLLGYFYRAYVNTFRYGGQCYVKNVHKHWKGGNND